MMFSMSATARWPSISRRLRGPSDNFTEICCGTIKLQTSTGNPRQWILSHSSLQTVARGGTTCVVTHSRDEPGGGTRAGSGGV